VMQRQHEQDSILLRPVPRLDQRLDLRRNVRVRRDDAARAPGRPARVDHHRRAIRCDFWQYRRRPGDDELRSLDEAVSATLGDRLTRARTWARGYHDFRIGVADGVLELRNRMRYGERDGNRPGAPDPPLHGHVIEPRGDVEADAGPIEVIAPLEKAGRYPAGRLEKLTIGVFPGLIDDCEPV